MEEGMRKDPEFKKDKQSSGLLTKTLCIIVCFSFIVITIMGVYLRIYEANYNNAKIASHDLSNELEEKTEEIVKLNKEVDHLRVEVANHADPLTACRLELVKLRDRMEGIKDDDDLLKRDIFLYIDKKFQLIPRTVATDIAQQILLVSKQENVSPELIVGIIQVESSFNPMAISKKNARGLMQVMPEWAPKFDLKKITDLHDIDINIQSGVKVLKIHIEEAKGSISKGLYYYVGKSDSYASKVYEAMGKFVAFRSTIDDDEINGNGEDKKDVEEKPIGEKGRPNA